MTKSKPKTVLVRDREGVAHKFTNATVEMRTNIMFIVQAPNQVTVLCGEWWQNHWEYVA